MKLRTAALFVIALAACSRDSRSATEGDLAGGSPPDLSPSLGDRDFSTADQATGEDLSTPGDLKAGCGDGVCNGTETNGSCPADCTSASDTCATMPACTTGSRIFVLYTQDASALCTTHMICSGGGGGCAVGSATLIGLCTTTSPSSYCPTSMSYGGHIGYTDCS